MKQPEFSPEDWGIIMSLVALGACVVETGVVVTQLLEVAYRECADSPESVNDIQNAILEYLLSTGVAIPANDGMRAHVVDSKSVIRAIARQFSNSDSSQQVH